MEICLVHVRTSSRLSMACEACCVLSSDTLVAHRLAVDEQTSILDRDRSMDRSRAMGANNEQDWLASTCMHAEKIRDLLIRLEDLAQSCSVTRAFLAQATRCKGRSNQLGRMLGQHSVAYIVAETSDSSDMSYHEITCGRCSNLPTDFSASQSTAIELGTHPHQRRLSERK